MSTYAGYSSIKDAIVTILGNVTSLKVVYGKNAKALLQFPCACVYADSDSEEFNSIGTGGSNEMTVKHHIDIHFRTDEGNDPDYEDILESVADDVKQALRSNVTLNSTCEYAVPAEGTWHYGEKETPTRVYSITTRASVHLRRDTGQLV